MISSNANSSMGKARCSAAGSLRRALNRALQIFDLEFGTPKDLAPILGGSCSDLRTEWERVAHEILRRTPVHGRRQCRLRLALKSCNRLFDVDCRSCDPAAKRKAKDAWASRMAEYPSQEVLSRCKAWIPSLKERVRVLASGWGERLVAARKGGWGEDPVFGEYVPDQQGCFEVKARNGGTLACSRERYSGDWSLVRLGCAKTKGKCRVVTMQSAEVKRVLTPVHNALYDHISSFGWCVRGDVRKEDFERVLGDCREGEEIISGDYTAATDNILLPAVEAIVDVISESSELTDLERAVLVGSFSNLRWLDSETGNEQPIRRGSMMGNLVSFPLLCLLNKAVFDLCCDVRGGDVGRVVRINGDDCVFAGDQVFFDTWVRLTSVFGLVVNEKKTGRSKRWMELNSQIYDQRGHSFVSKPILSFLLQPQRDEPGPVLGSVLRGISSFTWSTQQWIVGHVMRSEIVLRGVLSEIGGLGPRWRDWLAKRRWFRTACLVDSAPVRSKGVDRAQPTVVGPPPDQRIHGFVLEKAAELAREHRNEWMGKMVPAFSQKLDRRAFKEMNLKRFHSPRLSHKFFLVGWKWTFVWPKELLFFLKRRFPWLLGRDTRVRWREDHPLLHRTPVFIEKRSDRHKGFAPPEQEFLKQFPLGYS